VGPDPYDARDRCHALAERFDQAPNNLRYSDDALNMSIQAATHCDSLGHIFLDNTMYNGFEARHVDSGGDTCIHRLPRPLEPLETVTGGCAVPSFALVLVATAICRRHAKRTNDLCLFKRRHADRRPHPC
jgi:hypothetical protein